MNPPDHRCPNQVPTTRQEQALRIIATHPICPTHRVLQKEMGIANVQSHLNALIRKGYLYWEGEGRLVLSQKARDFLTTPDEALNETIIMLDDARERLKMANREIELLKKLVFQMAGDLFPHSQDARKRAELLLREAGIDP